MFSLIMLLVISNYTAEGQVLEKFLKSFVNLTNNTISGFSSKNDTILKITEKVTPDINKTFGLNSVTNSLQNVLPKKTKDQIAVMAANEDKFNAMWNHLNTSWTNFKERGAVVRKQLEDSGLLDRARNTTQTYNNYMTWRANLPFNKFDAKTQAFRDITAPLYDLRSEFIKARDDVVLERLKLQLALQSPVRSVAGSLSEKSTQISDQIKETEWKVLEPVIQTINDTRTIVNESGDGYRSIRSYIKVCALNPACCNNPQACIDQVEV